MSEAAILRPEVHPARPGPQVDSLPQEAAAISSDKMAMMVSEEVHRLSRVGRALDEVERLLLDPQVLSRLPPGQLTKVYEAATARFDSSSRFFVRLAELGVKANLIQELFGKKNGSRGTSKGVRSDDQKRSRRVLETIIDKHVIPGGI